MSWLLGDTTDTINNLVDGYIDVGITYCPSAEMQLVAKGLVLERVQAFRDHFLLIGPRFASTLKVATIAVDSTPDLILPVSPKEPTFTNSLPKSHMLACCKRYVNPPADVLPHQTPAT